MLLGSRLADSEWRTADSGQRMTLSWPGQLGGEGGPFRMRDVFCIEESGLGSDGQRMVDACSWPRPRAGEARRCRRQCCGEGGLFRMLDVFCIEGTTTGLCRIADSG